jgi:hypothetical protein
MPLTAVYTSAWLKCVVELQIHSLFGQLPTLKWICVSTMQFTAARCNRSRKKAAAQWMLINHHCSVPVALLCR